MDIATAPKALFPDKRIRLSPAETVKYAARLRDEWASIKPFVNFHQWLLERIFDAEERLIFTGVMSVIPEMMNLGKSYKDIAFVDVWARPEYGGVSWGLGTKCCSVEKPCPTHAAVPNWFEGL